MIVSLEAYNRYAVSCWTVQSEFLGLINLMFLLTTIMYDFLPVLIFRFFFHVAFLIIGSHIEFNSILGLLSRSLLPNICADSLRRLILQCSALSIICLLKNSDPGGVEVNISEFWKSKLMTVKSFIVNLLICVHA